MTSGRSAQPARHGEPRSPFALCLGSDATSKGSSFGGFPLQINLPTAAPTMPPCPPAPLWVARHPPAHTGQPGKGGPTSSALTVSRLHLDGAVHLQHTSGSGWSVAVPCPPEPCPWGIAGFGPSLAQGAEARSRGGICKNTARVCPHTKPEMPRAEGYAPAPGMGTWCLRRPPGRWCQPWPPAHFPRLQRTAEAAAVPGRTRPLQQHRHRSPLLDSHPILASSHASPLCVPTSVTRVCSRTCHASTHVPGPLPHGAISPPFSPSFSPYFSQKTLQLQLFPWQQACFPRDAAEPEPCARWGRHGNGGMSRMTGWMCTRTAPAHTGAAAHTRAAVAPTRVCTPPPQASPCPGPQI